eukprot:11185706-Lingulodinium_polyedra.AAC.1
MHGSPLGRPPPGAHALLEVGEGQGGQPPCPVLCDVDVDVGVSGGVDGKRVSGGDGVSRQFAITPRARV